MQQAKESMKELKQMVEQDQSKKMGVAEYNVCKRLQNVFRKGGKRAEHVYQDLKEIMKHQDGHHDDHHHDSHHHRRWVNNRTRVWSVRKEGTKH